MQRALVIAVIAGVVCKADSKPPVPAPRPAPAAPAPAAKHELVDTLLLDEPRFDHATPLAPLKIIEDREQAVQSWCMTGSDAQAIATAMAASLTAAGWGDVSSRGTPDRSVVGGTVDDVSVSITVGGRDAT